MGNPTVSPKLARTFIVVGAGLIGFVLGEAVSRDGGVLFGLGAMGLSCGAVALRGRELLDQVSFDLKPQLTQITRRQSVHEEQLDQVQGRLNELAESLTQSDYDRRLDDAALEEQLVRILDGLSSDLNQASEGLSVEQPRTVQRRDSEIREPAASRLGHRIAPGGAG